MGTLVLKPISGLEEAYTILTNHVCISLGSDHNQGTKNPAKRLNGTHTLRKHIISIRQVQTYQEIGSRRLRPDGNRKMLILEFIPRFMVFIGESSGRDSYEQIL